MLCMSTVLIFIYFNIYVYICVYICIFIIAHVRRILTNAVDPDLFAQHLLFGRDIQHLDSNYQFTVL